MRIMWWRERPKQVQLTKAGTLTDLQLARALEMGEGAPVRAGIMEIAARLEDAMLADAMSGNQEERLANLARIEGIRELLAQFLGWTTKLQEERERKLK